MVEVTLTEQLRGFGEPYRGATARLRREGDD